MRPGLDAVRSPGSEEWGYEGNEDVDNNIDIRINIDTDSVINIDVNAKGERQAASGAGRWPLF